MVKLSFLALSALIGLCSGGSLMSPAWGQTCTEHCRSDQIQFTPGDRLSVQVVNQSRAVVHVQQKPMTPPVTLSPGMTTEMGFGWGTQPNLAIYFWTDSSEQLIRVQLNRPAQTALQIEIYNAPSAPINGTVYIQNDGRVSIY